MADSSQQTGPKHEQPTGPVDHRTRAGAAHDVQTAPTAPAAGRRTELQPGDQFGRYRIERLLGEGAMGAVYLAQDETLHRPIALKIPTFPASDADGRIRFLREARSAALLRHAHICPIHDVGEIDGTQYLTMAFIDGQPLNRHIASAKRLSMRQIALFIRKIALALQEAHAAGIIHRDLKPANILVDRKGDPVLMDFGLARSFQENATGRITQSGALVGSPAYMSPEQAQGKVDELGPTSDIFSLGVICYELITGRLPFDGPLYQILNGIVNDPPPPMSPLRPDLDPNLEAICLQMMAKKPDDRFGSMKEVADALKAYPAAPASAKSHSVPERPAPSTANPSSDAARKTRAESPPLSPDDEWRTLPAQNVPTFVGASQKRHPSRGATTTITGKGDRWFVAIAIASGVAVATITLVLVLARSPSMWQGSSDGARNDQVASGSVTSPPAATSPPWQPAPTAPAAATEPATPLPPADDGPRPSSNEGTLPGTPPKAGALKVGTIAGQEWDANSLKMKFCWCPDGTFTMGSPASEKDGPDDEDDKDQVSVTLTGFWMAKHEVTQGEWKIVMGTTLKEQAKKGTNVRTIAGEGPTHPMYYVSHDEATEFARKYTQQERAAGRLSAGWEYRLPSEAQWEYACRAGTKTRFVSGDDESGLKRHAWFSANSESSTHEVGTKQPNAWGLCDMHGNVWEWCRDWYGSQLQGGRDPEVTEQASFRDFRAYRVYRGGCWIFGGGECRSAGHYGNTPGLRSSNVGFRMAAIRVSQ